MFTKQMVEEAYNSCVEAYCEIDDYHNNPKNSITSVSLDTILSILQEKKIKLWNEIKRLEALERDFEKDEE